MTINNDNEFYKEKLIETGGNETLCPPTDSSNFGNDPDNRTVTSEMDMTTGEYVVPVATTSDIASSTTNWDTTPTPHGNCLAFTCNQVAVCNDGVGESYGDVHHYGHTAYMDGVLNADIHRYIVIPGNVDGFSNLLGCVGVAVRSNGTYVFGVVGDIGPYRENGILDEYSVKMVNDLGFNTDGATYVSPAETVYTYIFPDTKRNSWPSATLNRDVESVGRRYFY